MKQNEFLNKLKIHLYNIPKDEQNRIIEYYSEIINDKIDDGQDEEQVIAELGSPSDIANSVIEDYRENENKNKLKPKKSASIGKIIWFTVLIPFALIAIVFLGAMIALFLLTSFIMVIGGLGYVVCSFALFAQFPVGVFQLGIGLTSCALGIFAGYGCNLLRKGFQKNIVKKIFDKYLKIYGGIGK